MSKPVKPQLFEKPVTLEACPVAEGDRRLDTILKCENLTKTFGHRKVVNSVDVRVNGGEVVGLLGPNGAGKTTIFYMMVGLLRPNSGKISLNGEEVSSLPMYLRARKGLGYLPQEPSVFRKLNVEDNLMAILETLPISKEERRERLESLLNELGLASLRRQKAYSLSGGERRRVEITRALVLSPCFILLDEPFAGIDPIAVLDIQSIVCQLKSKGIGIIITDHNVRETLGVCDRAYILNEGVILEEGTPEKIARSRKARKIYLGEGFKLAEMPGRTGRDAGVDEKSPDSSKQPGLWDRDGDRA
jgi:lipopolysaccharide export system ATP-binding protein